MSITGPDISSNQAHPIDFAKVKAAGHTFVIVKAGGDQTSRGTYRNPFFADDCRQARAAGLVVGPYHWVSNADPAPVVQAVRGVWRPGDLPVALDYEQAGISHSRLHQVRAAYRAAGFQTMTYTYPSFWQQMGDASCAECAADPLWYAAYQKTQPRPPKPWSKVTFWQYAGTSVVVPGIGGKQDMSRFIGTPAAFAALCGSAPQPSEEDIDMLLCQDPRSGGWWLLFTNNTKRPVVGGASLAAYQRAGVKDVTGLTAAEIDSYKAA